MNEFSNLFESIKTDPRKTRITITIDEELDKKLKVITDINVSGLCNQFLWYYIKRLKKEKEE